RPEVFGSGVARERRSRNYPYPFPMILGGLWVSKNSFGENPAALYPTGRFRMKRTPSPKQRTASEYSASEHLTGCSLGPGLMEMIHAVESKPVVVKGVIQQVNECKRLIYKGECQEKYFSLDRKWRRIA